MDTNELAVLIDEYNRVEADQRKRLITIYREMRDRVGSGRFIQFGRARKWTGGDFQPMEERFSLPMTIDPMVETITEYYLGEPGKDGEK